MNPRPKQDGEKLRGELLAILPWASGCIYSTPLFYAAGPWQRLSQGAPEVRFEALYRV